MPRPALDRYRGTRNWARWRRVSGFGVAALVGAIVVFEAPPAWPTQVGEYELSLLAGLVSDALIVGLLALLLLRPIQPSGADRLLTLGALLLSTAVVYRLAIELVHRLRDDPFSRGLPPPPFVDPWAVVTCTALGTWLLLLGVAQLAGAQAASSRRSSLALQVAAVLLGVVVVLLVAARAAFSSLQTFPDPLAENGSAGSLTAVTMLGWTALAVIALGRSIGSRAPRLLAGGALLVLAAAGLDAFTNLVGGSSGPPRTWFPSLLEWHDAYVYVALLNGLGWVTLFFGFLGLTGAQRLRRGWPDSSAPELQVDTCRP